MTREPEMTSIEAPTKPQLSPSVHWGTEDILEVPEFSLEEARDIWYNDFELAVIGNDAVQLAMTPSPKSSKTRKQSKPVDNHSMRGLEIMTVEGTLERLKAKVGIAAVLDEQERQRATGVRDEAAIALIACAQSLADVHRALALGLQDQERADEILERVRESPPGGQSPTTTKEGAWFRRKSASTAPVISKRPPVGVSRTMKRLFSRSKE